MGFLGNNIEWVCEKPGNGQTQLLSNLVVFREIISTYVFASCALGHAVVLCCIVLLWVDPAPSPLEGPRASVCPSGAFNGSVG